MQVAALSLVVAALSIGACGGQSRHAAEPIPTSPSAVPTTSTTLPPPVFPLTGVSAPSSADASQPAVVVKIDNIDAARPQTGVDKADVVYEELVEGGLTRLAAVYQSQFPTTVGPVRSGRLTDEGIIDDLGHPVFAYSGTNAIFLPQLRAQPITDVDDGNQPSQFWRTARAAPHNLYTNAAKLLATSSTHNPPPSLFSFLAAGGAFTGSAVTTASSIAIPFPQALIRWTWNASTGTWSRSQNGSADVLADGAQITATNILIEFIPYQISTSGYEGGSLVQVPTGTMTGTGTAWLLSQGQLVKGTWTRPSLTSPTVYADAAGNPFELTPGRTWVELPPTGVTLATTP